MANRTMVTIARLRDTIVFQAVRRGAGNTKEKTNCIIFTMEELERAMNGEYVSIYTSTSRIGLGLEIWDGEAMMCIRFDAEKEDTYVYVSKFLISQMERDEERKVLSRVKTTPTPKFEMIGAEKVLSNPILRKKFSKFVSTHFMWPGTTEVYLYPDKHSEDFFFTAYRQLYEKEPSDISGCMSLLKKGKNLRDSVYTMNT